MKNRFIRCSEYCLVQQKYESSDTILVFSAINTPKGKFRFTRALEHFDGNVIYFNSQKGNDWYTEGIDGLGEDYKSTAIEIKKLVKTYSGDSGKVITLGGSMGAYGAVLYGSLVDADYSIAVGTELITNLFNGRSVHVQKRIATYELNKIIENSKCMHHMVAGDNDAIDMLSYSYYRNHSSMKWYIFKNKPHTVIQYIHNKYTVLGLINQLKEYGRLIFESNDLNDYEYDLIDCIDKYMIQSIAKVVGTFGFGIQIKSFLRKLEKEKEFKTIVNLLQNKNLKENPAIMLIYFRALLRINNFSEAKNVYKFLKKTEVKEKVDIYAKRHNLI